MGRINGGIRRRSFLLTAAPLACGYATARAALPNASQLQGLLGREWRVPEGATVELPVLPDGPGLSAILAAVSSWSIPRNARLILRLAEGTHELQASVELSHADGARIAILGNVQVPSRIQLLWRRPLDLFYAPAGGRIELIDGLSIVHADAGSRGQGSAFLADNGGFIRCGSRVTVHGFYYGFQARYGGVIQCPGSVCSGGGDANYFAFNGGHIVAPNSKATHARDNANKLGSGYVAEYGGTIDAVNAVATDNAMGGFVALSNGVIRAYGSTAERNGRRGYYVNTGGVIVAHDSVARLNCEDSVKVGSSASAIEGNRLIKDDLKPAEDICQNLRFR